MSDHRLFAITKTANTVIVTPRRCLSGFNFVDEEAEISMLLGSIAKLGGRHVVIDLAASDYCGSSALGFFTRLSVQSRKRGGEVAFCNVSPHTHEVLHRSRFDMRWPIFSTVTDALEGVEAMFDDEVTWILAADRGTARIYEQPQSRDGKLIDVTELVHPESRLKFSETTTDRKMGVRGGAGGVAIRVGQPAEDHRHRTAHDFAREVAEYLDDARQHRRYQRLILIAAPLFLGELRECLTPATSKLVTQESHRDYARLGEEAIRRHLDELARAS